MNIQEKTEEISNIIIQSLQNISFNEIALRATVYIILLKGNNSIKEGISEKKAQGMPYTNNQVNDISQYQYQQTGQSILKLFNSINNLYFIKEDFHKYFKIITESLAKCNYNNINTCLDLARTINILKNLGYFRDRDKRSFYFEQIFSYIDYIDLFDTTLNIFYTNLNPNINLNKMQLDNIFHKLISAIEYSKTIEVHINRYSDSNNTNYETNGDAIEQDSDTINDLIECLDLLNNSCFFSEEYSWLNLENILNNYVYITDIKNSLLLLNEKYPMVRTFDTTDKGKILNTLIYDIRTAGPDSFKESLINMLGVPVEQEMRERMLDGGSSFATSDDITDETSSVASDKTIVASTYKLPDSTIYSTHSKSVESLLKLYETISHHDIPIAPSGISRSYDSLYKHDQDPGDSENYACKSPASRSPTI